MKTILVLMFVCTSVFLKAQDFTLTIIYNLDHPEDTSVLNVRSAPLPVSGEVEIIWYGSNIQPDCKVVIDQYAIPCSLFPAQKLRITRDGQIPQTNIRGITRDMNVSMINRDKAFMSRKVGGWAMANAPTTVASNAPDAKRFREVHVPESEPLPWKDALLLSEAIDKEDGELAARILCKYYTKPGEKCKGYDAIFEEITKDKNYLLLNILQTAGGNKFIPSDKVVSAQASTTDAAIISPKIALDAIGTFIAKRLADELNRAYLDRLRDTLNAPGFADFRTMLPHTHAFLLTIGRNNTIDYKSILTGLRQNLFEDLSGIPLNAQGLIKNHRQEILRNNKKELYIAGLAMLNATDALQQKADAAEVLSRLGAYDYELPIDSNSNIRSAIMVIATISNHLRLHDPYGPWIDVKTDWQDFSKFYLFAGLVYKLDRPIFTDYRFKTKNGWKSLHEMIQSRDTKKYVEIVQQTLGLMLDLAKIIKDNKTDPQSFDRFLTLNERILTMVAHCSETESTQITNALALVRAITQIKSSVLNKDFVAAGTQVFGLLDQIAGIRISDAGKNEFFRYLSFAQNLIDAKNKEELIAALEQAADPVGNYRLKRQYPFTASITTYPGLFAGRERHEEGVNNNTVFNTYGFTAPVGLAFSITGQGKGPAIRDYASSPPEEATPKPSWTIFMPLIDVGAITAFRLMDQNSELPEISWANFISPGLFLNYGFKNNLLTIHTGVQVGPEIQQLGNDKRPRLWRFGVGVSADLHLFSIYTKPERN